MDLLTSNQVLCLDSCDRNSLLNYFENSWQLEDTLMSSLSSEDIFYANPDPLRNPLIFYLGHSAVFYINKLIRVGLLETGINPTYETLFEMGVDPTTPAELDAALHAIDWPAVSAVWQYRGQAKSAIIAAIQKSVLDLPIRQNHPLWALIMGIEHSHIHFETSSMLLRQLPVASLNRPDSWHYAESHGSVSNNSMQVLPGGVTQLGKPLEASTYGWDSEYGHRQVSVKPFAASQYLVTNGEFLQFVAAGGYDNSELWDAEAWQWKTDHTIQHPKFWIPTQGGFYYRAMFDQMALPLDWPVEVNHYEAMAYCRWQGQGVRLMTEAEWTLATMSSPNVGNYNLNLKFGSPSPVGSLASDPMPFGLSDLRGNVWEWLNDDFAPLPGFQPHPLYEDYSAPFFDTQHKMLLGGAWASTGSYAASRNWFRPNFYQHAGFRIAQNIDSM